MVNGSYVARGDVTYVLGCLIEEALNNVQELLVIAAVPSAWPKIVTDGTATFQVLTLKPAFLECIVFFFVGRGQRIYRAWNHDHTDVQDG